ncbi:3-(3-hydroxy-phenyl)propionate hydroxylase [Phycicoccus badiiscoriae]|uniref:3-(3-hydroxy-phenyl)propionate hydroxylase n=1 Tax=Pedococcus badiiscoriae TaxID=642776 RepID=A0A852WRM4_9MICO|nr:FAD-dependent monooxygenase [Pedococcus badiiscoriae]NYG07852.1 3-(3-hydroxy-phenyl)propionate hydroxylase [Pedococcus badiiscoriae]
MVDVVVVGAGPTGLMVAGELTLAGVDVEVVERRATPELVGSRAGGFHARTIEILDQRGIADRFLAEGKTYPAPYSGRMMLDLSDFPTRHPYTLGLWQNHIERILAGWVHELGVPIRRGVDVTGLDQDDEGVELRLSDGQQLRAKYVVGADGGRSVVRKAAGIDFPGWEATTSALIAEVEVTEELPSGIKYDASGLHGLSFMEDGRTVRVVSSESELGVTTEPTLADLSANLTSVYGTDFGVHHPTWISRFTDATRQAAAYRSGRVLVAGDAAHIHSPAGGQGIGLGIQDAVNLGWKLAQVVRGTSPQSLLDTYHAERHPAGARALEYSKAVSALQRHDARIAAVRDLMDRLVAMDEPRRHVVGLISGLDVHYDLGEGHPLLGRRMPDLDIVTAGGAVRVYSLLHRAGPVLISFGPPGRITPGPWADRVAMVDASYEGAWELPVIGTVDAPAAVLVRPDGHVAWVGDGTPAGLEEALGTWFGPPDLQQPSA